MKARRTRMLPKMVITMQTIIKKAMTIESHVSNGGMTTAGAVKLPGIAESSVGASGKGKEV